MARGLWHTGQGADVALQTAQANSTSSISLKAAEKCAFLGVFTARLLEVRKPS
ncbi:MAG TPA: hypothetical protein VEI29_01595 [Burkholderiaceae bacterium]|nr:hypothetical protein [Burkholderiaceae bacterium]